MVGCGGDQIDNHGLHPCVPETGGNFESHEQLAYHYGGLKFGRLENVLIF